jgi:hypothetical protein
MVVLKMSSSLLPGVVPRSAASCRPYSRATKGPGTSAGAFLNSYRTFLVWRGSRGHRRGAKGCIGTPRDPLELAGLWWTCFLSAAASRSV